MSPILTVIGATGTQGGSVVASALKNGTYKVRAITRNVNSDKAQKLVAQGVEVVTADLDDEESLVRAFEGSTAIFAVTDFFEPFGKSGPEHAIKVEAQQGKNLANAAIRTSTLKHYIWSTLPDSVKISNGKYAIPHFVAKNEVDRYIRSKPELLEKTTFMWVTWFAGNYSFPMFTPNYLKSSGKYLQLQPVAPSVPIFTIGDTHTNVGIFTSAILAKPDLTIGGKFVLAFVERTTIGEVLQTWSKATGKPSAYAQVTSLEEFDRIWPMWGHEMGLMMQFWEEVKERSWSGEEGIVTKYELGIEEDLVGLEPALRTTDWSFLD